MSKVTGITGGRLQLRQPPEPGEPDTATNGEQPGYQPTSYRQVRAQRSLGHEERVSATPGSVAEAVPAAQQYERRYDRLA